VFKNPPRKPLAFAELEARFDATDLTNTERLKAFAECMQVPYELAIVERTSRLAKASALAKAKELDERAKAEKLEAKAIRAELKPHTETPTEPVVPPVPAEAVTDAPAETQAA